MANVKITVFFLLTSSKRCQTEAGLSSGVTVSNDIYGGSQLAGNLRHKSNQLVAYLIITECITSHWRVKPSFINDALPQSIIKQLNLPVNWPTYHRVSLWRPSHFPSGRQTKREI